MNRQQTETRVKFDALRGAANHALAYLENLDQQPVGARVEYETLRARLGGPLPETGSDAARVIDDLVAATEGGHLGSAGGRFFAWVIGGGVESSVAADWLTSIWDQNAALHACAPAAGVVEEVAGAWLKELLDLPREASFALTTGCQLAHFTCLAAARHAVLRDVGWDVNALGLFGAPPVRIITSDQRHGTLARAIRFLGFGDRSVVAVGADQQGCVDVAAVEAALRAHAGPAIVALNAADLNIGAFDPFEVVIPIARAAGAWTHVDGAFGLIARASRAKRKLTSGVELADSWATDAHKWLNVPYDCGVAIVRDRDAHRASMTMSASYLTADKQARDQMDWNPEWSRRARGFPLYAALRELGRAGVEQIVDRCCDHALAIVDGIGGLPGAEVLWRPTLNQGLARFRDTRPGASAVDHDARTDAIIAAVNASGEAFFSGTTWRGMRAMRVSVVNWRTNAEDVRRAIEAVRSALKRESA